ncbi:PDZ domain-containing protein [Desulfoscipio gibsoniae]|uniref:Periplasmic protease n=1 Tax=Desulfoscipio gibsoniae DSM 7213 TaxID=767817 RepID=R4KSL6_9FIRM|nr:PDZ domain-containing protein [Desulfoscipio gibsoniae]AGL03570.1 periplasmic protease [Desulfoscipio gibsoniae DSM 7213]
MFPFGDILPMIIVNMELMLREPIFWIVVVLIGLQYRRMHNVRESIYGMPLKSNWSEVGTALLLGMLGGMLGSILMVFIGVTLTGSGLMYIWPLAILLMLIDARFICFAYAGGILALSRLLFGFPQVNVTQVLALVAVLHMVESILIFFSGHLGAVPAFFRDRTGRVVGGFTLQKFWPIPIAALAFMAGIDVPPGSVDMPEWWPLISPGAEDAENIVYTLIPVVAALGYGDMAIARSPRQKGWISAGYLALYSLVLLLLAVLSDRSWLLGVLAALFSPLGHELVIYIGRKLEIQGEPVHVPHPDGLVVLDVLAESPAWRAGMRSGDLLVAVNGVPVRSRAELEAMLYIGNQSLQVDYINRKGRRCRGELSYSNKQSPLGILPVPEGDEQAAVMDLSTAGPLGRWFSGFWRWLGR